MTPDDQKEERKDRKRIYMRLYRAAHRQKIREQQRASQERNKYKHASSRSQYNKIYAIANRDRLNSQRRVRRAHNKDAINRQKAAWYAANRDKVIEKVKHYAKANDRKVRARQFSWRNANREKIRAYNKDRYESNPAYFRESTQKRRARKLAAPGAFTAADWRALVARSPRCHWCGKPFNKSRRPTHDHVVPLSKGGANSPENSVCACHSCNSRKSAGCFDPVSGQGILI